MAKEKPLILSAPMVRATLKRQKTETRRVIKPEWSRCLDLDDPEDCASAIAQNPYGQPGDNLWVRETIYYNLEHDNYYYTADNQGVGEERYLQLKALPNHPKGVPSIYMYRWASRILLKIRMVYVDELHAISTTDIIAEGLEIPDVDYSFPAHPRQLPDHHPYRLEAERDEYARGQFRELWDRLNAARGYLWESNPRVFVIKYSVEEVLVPTGSH